MNPTPFFDSGAPAVAPRRRLLLISYCFAPSPATGALRWQRMATMAAERGFGLDVITLDPVSLSTRDDSRLAELPRGVRIFGVPAARHPIEGLEAFALRTRRAFRRSSAGGNSAPSATNGVTSAPRAASFSRQEIERAPFSLRGAARSYHVWLDHSREGLWAKHAAALGLRIFDRTLHGAVITCGPPHMAHEAGRLISRSGGLPLVVDLRDPWSLVQRLPEGLASRRWFRTARHYEKGVLAEASLVVLNTDRARAAMQEAYPSRADRIMTAMNGFDPESIPAVARDDCFRIRYAGTIYLDRDPRPLFRAAAAVIRERSLRPEDFALEFMGHIGDHDGVPVADIARQEGLEGYLRTFPPQPRARALEFLAGASLLVSLPQDSDMAVPAKVFEYMLFDAGILALAEPGSATEVLLRGTGADVVAPGDLEGLTAALGRRYADHARGVRPERLARDDRFSRRAQATLLFDALENRVLREGDLSPR